jgi:hypothetical protein
MSLTELLAAPWTPIRRRLRIAFLKYQIASTTRNREVLLKQAENDRLAAQYLQRENCIMRADLNLLLGRKEP